MEHFIIGDLHQCAFFLSKNKFIEQKELTKDNIVFQLGDFGFYFSYPENLADYKREYNKRKELASKKYTLFIIPGNHENYDLINALPLIEKWGGLVYEEKFSTGSIYLAKRGEIYTIDGKTIFTFSGAQSFDGDQHFSISDVGTYKKIKKYRYGELKSNRLQKIKISNVNYWPQEIPTKEEYDYALSNLKKFDFKVDYIFSHTGPASIIEDFINPEDLEKIDDPISAFFDIVYQKIDFKHWYFGHCHTNITKGPFTTHYKEKPLPIIF